MFLEVTPHGLGDSREEENYKKTNKQSLNMFLKEQPERDLAIKPQTFTCKYADTSLRVQYGNKNV